ncbi:ribonuclease HII [Portibacter lacus]|uniref:Ribonuclease HII n=1 Tax=Portibacter lacus TaxID=1099794 RepID=A0AA37WFU6_9BACT|nr:ribonuclease HII [Portibacter lacus]GLR19002.1 ribonuclease HII [Portibacter lacus]
MLLSYKNSGVVEAGCDEAGRGCIAGPVFAAAVILPPDFQHPILNDSKKISRKQRRELKTIIEKEAIAWSVAKINPKEIDQINILNASFKAMHKAIDKLSVEPEHLLIDGNRFNPFKEYTYECIIKGDGKYNSIAAASILAKTYRDDFMEKFANRYPYYSWETNKGYPTRDHRKAVMEHGPCIHHRRSFRLYPSWEQAKLF